MSKWEKYGAQGDLLAVVIGKYKINILNDKR